MMDDFGGNATPLLRYNATPLQTKLALERYNATRVCYYIIYNLYLISYILFIFLVERIQLFSRAVCPKRVGDVPWA